MAIATLVLRAKADNETLQHHPMVLKNNQHQLLTTRKARELIEEETTNPHPPPPRNTGGDPDPDDDPDDDDDGEDDRGRKGGRPARAPRRPSIPRDASLRTRAMVTFMESLAVPIRQTKLIAEPLYCFQGEDNQDVRNWLTACEDYFDRNPTQWENHTHRIVFALGKTKGNKIAPFGRNIGSGWADWVDTLETQAIQHGNGFGKRLSSDVLES